METKDRSNVRPFERTGFDQKPRTPPPSPRRAGKETGPRHKVKEASGTRSEPRPTGWPCAHRGHRHASCLGSSNDTAPPSHLAAEAHRDRPATPPLGPARSREAPPRSRLAKPAEREDLTIRVPVPPEPRFETPRVPALETCGALAERRPSTGAPCGLHPRAPSGEVAAAVNRVPHASAQTPGQAYQSPFEEGDFRKPTRCQEHRSEWSPSEKANQHPFRKRSPGIYPR